MRCRYGWMLLLGLTLAPARLLAQGRVPLFVAGLGGGSFTTGDAGPAGSGGGFAYQAEVGLRLSGAGFGAEYSHYDTGSDRKTNVYGGFLRISSFGSGAIRPYLVLGLGSYRFNPATGRSSTFGGSVGPGAIYRPLGSRIGLLLEARFHTTFDHLSGVNSQEFLSVVGGLEFGL